MKPLSRFPRTARRSRQGARRTQRPPPSRRTAPRLENRRHEIADAINSEVSEFDSAVREAAQAGRTWWNDTKTSMKRPLDEVRARVEKRPIGARAPSRAARCGRGRGRRRLRPSRLRTIS
jgi:hypothetical protein